MGLKISMTSSRSTSEAASARTARAPSRVAEGGL